MKANSIVKILTGVVILLFTSLGMGQTTTAPAAAAPPAAAAGAPASAAAIAEAASSAEITYCSNLKNKEANPAYFKKKCGTADDVSSCKESKKDYLDKLGKQKIACSGFTQERGNDGKLIPCSKKFANCQAEMNGLFNDSGSSSGSNGINTIIKLAQQSANKSLGISDANQTPTKGNCIEEFDPKVVRDSEEKKAKEIKELDKQIVKQKEDQIKLEKEQSKKEDDINEKIAKIEADIKKDILDKDKKISEETRNVSRETADSAKRLRLATMDVTKKSQTLASANFEYQTAMLELTDEKVSQQCKSQFEALKSAIKKAKTAGGAPAPNASPEEKKQYESLLSIIGSGTGFKVNAAATTFLSSTKKTCFEKAETSKNKNMMIHQQAVQNLNADISEAKKKIDDEKGALERENVKLLQIKQHAELEKNADEVEKSKKLLNLNSELTKFATSIQKEIELSKAQADKLANDIKVLVLKTNLNAKPAMSDAAKAISDYESARIEAEADCCSDLNEKKKPFCKAIYKEEKFDKTPQKPELSTGAESTGV